MARNGEVRYLVDILYDCNCEGGGSLPEIPFGLVSDIASRPDRQLILGLLLAHGDPNEQDGTPLWNAVVSKLPGNIAILQKPARGDPKLYLIQKNKRLASMRALRR